MKSKLTSALILAALIAAVSAFACAQERVIPTPSPEPFVPTPTPSPVVEATPEPEGPQTVTEYRWFINSYKNIRTVKASYYDNVFAVNHGEYGLTPFAADVPAEYFIEDEQGYLAPAPIVLDVTNAMRLRLYGEDKGELGLLYGQFCERASDGKGKTGFTGIHEGIDFLNAPGAKLHTIIDGVVTRAGDSNGTVAVYNEFYDVTVLYLHCENIQVRKGDVLAAGVYFADEGSVGSGSSYAHVEMRWGRHTSSNAYRNAIVESDCPYELMRVALSVEASDVQPMTYAAFVEAETARLAAEAEAERLRLEAEAEAERMRLEAEAKAKAEAEAAAATPTPEPTPEVKLVDTLPGSNDSGYGFAEQSPTPAPTVEATLPPG